MVRTGSSRIVLIGLVLLGVGAHLAHGQLGMPEVVVTPVTHQGDPSAAARDRSLPGALSGRMIVCIADSFIGVKTMTGPLQLSRERTPEGPPIDRLETGPTGVISVDTSQPLTQRASQTDANRCSAPSC